MKFCVRGAEKRRSILQVWIPKAPSLVNADRGDSGLLHLIHPSGNTGRQQHCCWWSYKLKINVQRNYGTSQIRKGLNKGIWQQCRALVCTHVCRGSTLLL